VLRIGSDGSFGFGHAAPLSSPNPSTNSSSLPEENVQELVHRQRTPNLQHWRIPAIPTAHFGLAPVARERSGVPYAVTVRERHEEGYRTIQGRRGTTIQITARIWKAELRNLLNRSLVGAGTERASVEPPFLGQGGIVQPKHRINFDAALVERNPATLKLTEGLNRLSRGTVTAKVAACRHCGLGEGERRREHQQGQQWGEGYFSHLNSSTTDLTSTFGQLRLCEMLNAPELACGE